MKRIAIAAALVVSAAAFSTALAEPNPPPDESVIRHMRTPVQGVARG